MRFSEKTRWLAGAALCAALFVPVAVQAQQALPPTRDELRQTVPTDAAATPRSKITVSGNLDRGPCPFATAGYAGVTVNFADVRFSAPEGFSTTPLTDTWREFAGRDVPLATLCEVRDRAAAKLKSMGYLAAVQVPPQRIDKGGTVALDLLVAKLVDVEVRGEPGPSRDLIAAHLQRLRGVGFFSLATAERELMLLKDMPGYDVSLVLRPAPGGARGEVVGTATVTRTPVEVLASVQNLGSNATGRFGGFLQVALNDLLGAGDRTTLSVFNTTQIKEQSVFQLTHELALGSSGLRANGRLTYARGQPQLGTSTGFRTETVIGELGLTYPVIRRQTLTLQAGAGIEYTDQTVDFAKTRLSTDKLRVAVARLELSAIDPASVVGGNGFNINEPHWRVGASIEARHGFAGLGSSRLCVPLTRCLAPKPTPSNIYADPQAFVLRGAATMEYRPTPTFTIAFSPRWQYSGSALLPYEQFSIGNYSVGRGYDPGAIQSDAGIAGALELRFGQALPSGPRDLVLQPYLFFDHARAWINDKGVTPDPLMLSSTGAGFRARWGNHADLNLALAFPLDVVPGQTRRPPARLLFTLTTRLVPWSNQ